MAQISRPFQIALLAMVVLAGVWFFALQGHSSSGGSSPTASGACAHAGALAELIRRREKKPRVLPRRLHLRGAPASKAISRRDPANAHKAVATSEQNANTARQQIRNSPSSPLRWRRRPTPSVRRRRRPAPAQPGRPKVSTTIRREYPGRHEKGRPRPKSNSPGHRRQPGAPPGRRSWNWRSSRAQSLQSVLEPKSRLMSPCNANVQLLLRGVITGCARTPRIPS